MLEVVFILFVLKNDEPWQLIDGLNIVCKLSDNFLQLILLFLCFQILGQFFLSLGSVQVDQCERLFFQLALMHILWNPEICIGECFLGHQWPIQTK